MHVSQCWRTEANSACAAGMDSAIRYLREAISTQAANTVGRDQEVIH